MRVIHIMSRDSQNSGSENNERIDVFFTAEKWDGEIENMEPQKCDDLSWFDLDNLPENIIPYIREVIKHIKNKVFYSEHGWKD